MQKWKLRRPLLNQIGTNRYNYDEFERTVIEQSKEQGFHTYEISISLREDCLLKAARVYMVFEVLRKLGEIIKSTPPVEQLEEEQFDQSLRLHWFQKKLQQKLKRKS